MILETVHPFIQGFIYDKDSKVIDVVNLDSQTLTWEEDVDISLSTQGWERAVPWNEYAWGRRTEVTEIKDER